MYLRWLLHAPAIDGTPLSHASALGRRSRGRRSPLTGGESAARQRGKFQPPVEPPPAHEKDRALPHSSFTGHARRYLCLASPSLCRTLARLRTLRLLQPSASLLHAHLEQRLLLERVVFRQQHRAAHQRRTRNKRAKPKAGSDKSPESSPSPKGSFREPSQLVDATHWLNRSAGVWKSSVFRGRSLSWRATMLR